MWKKKMWKIKTCVLSKVGFESYPWFLFRKRKSNGKFNWFPEKENIFICAGGVYIKGDFSLYLIASGVPTATERITLSFTSLLSTCWSNTTVVCIEIWTVILCYNHVQDSWVGGMNMPSDSIPLTSCHHALRSSKTSSAQLPL